MKQRKLLLAVAAILVTAAGSTFLAMPAYAVMSPCDAIAASYAQGYCDGKCGGVGTGTVTSCSQNGTNVTFSCGACPIVT